MSSRTRPPEREGDFTWEEPYGTRPSRRRPPARRGPGGGGARKVAMPVVGIALVVGLLIGFLVGGSGGTTTVSETVTVTSAAEPAGPAASGADSRPDITLAVLNGSDQDGLAARTGERLRGLGYVQVSEGNAPSRVPADRVLYRPGAEAQAMQVANDLDAGEPIPLPDGGAIAAAAPDADVIAIMGPEAGGDTGASVAPADADAGAAPADGGAATE